MNTTHILAAELEKDNPQTVGTFEDHAMFIIEGLFPNNHVTYEDLTKIWNATKGSRTWLKCAEMIVEINNRA